MQEEAKYQIIFTFIWVLRILCPSDCYRFEPNTLTLNNFTKCPGDEENTAHLNFSISRLARNKYVINGEVMFEETHNGPLEVFEGFKIKSQFL